MPFSLFVYYNEMVHTSKTTKDTTSAQENFFCLEKIYQMMPKSIHLTKVEKSGPDWSGPVVHVASGLQKLMQSARRDIGDLKKDGGLISLGVYLDLKRFY